MSKPGSSAFIQDAFDFVEATETIDDIETLNRTFAQRLSVHGFTTFACAGITGPGGAIRNEEFFGRPHRQWEARYFSKEYFRQDAVIRIGWRTNKPFFWHEIQNNHVLRPEEQLLFNEASEFGIGNGFITPVRNFDGSFSVVSMGGQEINDDPKARTALHLMSLYFAGMGRRLKIENDLDRWTDLTTRQREIITLLAAGYRQSEIAARLALSERTVETHLALARIRLNVATTPQLCVEALRLGLINP
ncbi:MAG: helix-turn-helix transcriptional regulator [Caulobacterales bacterium]|uniref:helix-turn-helix transcriptional regulator n=1 Tax=Glycocaulis sp. TaxID=1969725 RepID=UPI003F9FA85B